MLPVQQCALRDADAARERALRKAGAGPDRRNIDSRHRDLVNTRVGLVALSKLQRLVQPLLDASKALIALLHSLIGNPPPELARQ